MQKFQRLTTQDAFGLEDFMMAAQGELTFVPVWMRERVRKLLEVATLGGQHEVAFQLAVMRKLPRYIMRVDNVGGRRGTSEVDVRDGNLQKVIDFVRFYVVTSLWKIDALIQHSYLSWTTEPQSPVRFNALGALTDVRSAAEEAGRFAMLVPQLITDMKEDKIEALLQADRLVRDPQERDTSIRVGGRYVERKPAKTDLVDTMAEDCVGTEMKLYDLLSKYVHPQAVSLGSMEATMWQGASRLSACPDTAFHQTTQIIIWQGVVKIIEMQIVKAWKQFPAVASEFIERHHIDLHHTRLQLYTQRAVDAYPHGKADPWQEGMWSGFTANGEKPSDCFG